MSGRAFSRLDVDERRRRLLELGAELFTRHTYDELSMAQIARTAGISKALLYHYFPSKRAYFQATLTGKARELAARTAPDPALAPLDQLRASVDAYLGWVEENPRTYERLRRSVGTAPELRAVVEEVRAATAARILAGLTGGTAPAPRTRTAVAGWLWYLDGVCLDWIAHRDLGRGAVADLLVETLLGAVGPTPPPAAP